MAASGIHVNSGCCFDLGNAETNNHDNGPSHMDAIHLRCDSQGNLHVGLDMEAGTYPGFPVPAGLPFVTAMGVNDGQNNYAVYWGNAQTECLTTTGSLTLPKG
jgi:non-reducing end alpha-L-arabinofuranosidase